jgi:uncharacterized protein with von Willebrand factor type A (vWA) domain
MSDDVRATLAHLAGFCHALRERGVATTPGDLVVAAHALDALGGGDRDDVRLALRAVLPRRQRDLAVFDVLFDAWWSDALPTSNLPGSDAGRRIPPVGPPTDAARATPTASFLSRWAATSGGDGRDTMPIAIPIPSPHDARGTKDFAAYTDDDPTAVEEAAARIARRLRARPSRRWVQAWRGTRIDPRRVVRRSLRAGGEPVELVFRARTRRRTKLVVLCDVSGSMDLYSRFLLQLLYALQHAFARVETFAFSTRLVRITDALARDGWRDALGALSRVADGGWSGGTKIGACLASFLSAWPRALDRRTVAIVLSDGWDTGEPEALGSAMRAMHRRAGRVVWLNPLLGSPRYEPLTRGMRAALPHVDVFAPAHDLASLDALAAHLSL